MYAIGGVAVMLMELIFGYSSPDFRAFSDHVMTPEAMEKELARLHEINLTVAKGGLDPSL